MNFEEATEIVPPGFFEFTEGVGPPVKTEVRGKKLNIRDLMDGDSLISGPVVFDADMSTNKLAEEAYAVALQKWKNLPVSEQAVMSAGSMAIDIFNELRAKARVAPSSRGDSMEENAEEFSRVKSLKKVPRPTLDVLYDLDLPGLGATPKLGDTRCTLSYFLANGSRTTVTFPVQWVIEQDTPAEAKPVWALVFDSRAVDIDTLPVIDPVPDATCKLAIEAKSPIMSFEIAQAVLKLNIGKLHVWVVGE